jgi:hypothetical protein
MSDVQGTYLITAFKVTDLATTIEACGEEQHCQARDLGSKAQAPLPRSGIAHPTLLHPCFSQSEKKFKHEVGRNVSSHL